MKKIPNLDDATDLDTAVKAIQDTVNWLELPEGTENALIKGAIEPIIRKVMAGHAGQLPINNQVARDKDIDAHGLEAWINKKADSGKVATVFNGGITAVAVVEALTAAMGLTERLSKSLNNDERKQAAVSIVAHAAHCAGASENQITYTIDPIVRNTLELLIVASKKHQTSLQNDP